MSNEKLNKGVDESRASRNMEDREITENRVFTDNDRLSMFRQQFFSIRTSGLAGNPRISRLLAHNHKPTRLYSFTSLPWIHSS